jgi:HD-GYP domain-containing protein (c-di-GMP phosphodiesterase class II)
VGKIAIPNSILNKPDRLTPVEWAVVKLHPLKGVELLEPLRFLASGLSVVRYHHERYDGDGYPEGLRGEDIPLLARIVSCADAFDAMTADRPYRKERLSTQEAILELRKNSSSQFDPYLSKVFISILKKE